VKTWQVTFQEKATPTIIASTNGKDAPSTGRNVQALARRAPHRQMNA